MSLDEAAEKHEAEAGQVIQLFMDSLDVDEDVADIWSKRVSPLWKKWPMCRWKR